ncbi:hypothetical protein [Rhizobium sp. AB2/73]|uniref:hypothetical protein n=1 Tax=Rhizobium sp. AB2/73 TaxID=2795216 RepID=UPI001C5E3205|nr:hypothetical protein [Rhizobium sp. AB2/73]QYA14080.1 hypothetical protein J5284_07715 [Rhizobium sp. AB2/73]UEQ79989.1 hypothetical protein I8E17_14285 [Rhizobium sp. AB2/73]
MIGDFDSLLDDEEPVAVPRKRGRPKGSKNNPAIAERRQQRTVDEREAKNATYSYEKQLDDQTEAEN